MDEQILQALQRLSDENDRITAAYREAHKMDPCSDCGTFHEVRIIPTGSLAKLTPLCPLCIKKLQAITEAWHRGYAEGRRFEMQLPWWKRVFRCV